ncbi:restriction endonuclease subunit S [Ferroacidibacillus organovorans]|uniref:Type I restriction modification DNA specificity domain-containing protein n=1 Tax=Ferroacidibacillus organovorans TaxID=1765683 RepID=A0A853K9L2_9BACL|nr:restriction endonuclease subunit S [Ferroacidibacillus organovorans]KYP80058.1 hypothetical protein AYJ22_12615 [Ferroacidibacillus organovorans]OAG93086.1 hypothetical protein AYW79_12485 [Ferroacidibacillus organovorans]
MSFTRYEKYKGSGVEWLGEVPEHWEVKRIGYFFEERREKVSDKDYPPLSVTKNGVVPQLESAAKTDDGDNRKRVCKGDFVINSRSDRKGSSGAASLDGSVSLINIVLKTRGAVRIDYVHHLFRSFSFQEEFYRFGKGIVADLWSTNYSEMCNITMAIPPVSEQHAIAEFLDNETMKIDMLLEEQEKLINLIREKRQAVISHTVTNGLDPTAPMKDSGIEWLGEVPEHWGVVPLKTVISTIESGTSVNAIDTPALQGELGVLKLSCVYNGRFDPSENKTVLPEEVERVSCSLRAGCLVVSRGNTPDLVGSAGLVKEDHEGIFLSDLLWQVHCTNVEAAFAHYWTLTRAYRWQIHLACTGTSSSMQKITKGKFRQFVFLQPPLLEQEDVVKFLDTETDKLDRLVNQAERAIELLKERRSALISAAVTGKIDVRGLAAEGVTA